MGQRHASVWRRVSIGFFLALSVVFLGGCQRVQFRMADPMIGASEVGKMDAPLVTFEKRHGVHDARAVIAWENPNSPVRNRVNLRTRSTYNVRVRLPENYEFRRLQVLQGKSETLYQAIDAANAELRENTGLSAKLLGEEARSVFIDGCGQLRGEIEKRQVEKARTNDEAERRRLDEAIDRLVAELSAKNEELAKDDEERDKLLSPTMTESLVGQIEDWRGELNRIKARIVALNLMVRNGNAAYPRIIRGTIQVFDRTPFAEVGAIPLEIEDEFLDWVRQDKVVTVVSYDPNEKPADRAAAARRAHLPQHWPQEGLTVIEFTAKAAPAPASVHGGVSPVTQINDSSSNGNYFNCRATVFRGENGYERTYVRSQDGRRMWVFGPDLTPPTNVEVWLQDAKGLPVEKVYPPDARGQADEVFVRQIAGVEGGAFDPVVEAQKRGKIIAITRLGNRRDIEDDSEAIQHIHARELKRARVRAGEVSGESSSGRK